MTRQVDYSLYLVTDQALCLGRKIMDVVLEAVQGGVTIVQIREKNTSAKAFYELAVAMRKNLAPKNIPLIINDRVDVALAADADGVHVGQSDMPFPRVREIMGPDKILGISINSFDQLSQSSDLVDYFSMSPVFPTPTKTDTSAPFGLKGLEKARKMTSKPLITIGGIKPENIKEVMATGVDGVALVSAVCSAPSPEKAARQLMDLIRQSRQTI
ncbi:thiamine phosphate synthase [Desulfonatronovibrio hydrogenovorans]|uniref:thiamine phosphate synthase n=1 Tax=Desulfonatronovibrio hydrogenovorans TaxID=53245 RepID=UPI00048F49E2|nr:thiamine phosphate synthase [Desulfonatronovibrio hydrogenovorans]